VEIKSERPRETERDRERERGWLCKKDKL